MSSNTLLVINAGSSSLKFSVFRVDDSETLRMVMRGQIDGIGTRPSLRVKDATNTVMVERNFPITEVGGVKDAIELVGTWLRERLQHEPLLAVGHRVVHGGIQFSHPVLIDTEVFAALEQLIPLASLHQPHNLTAIRAIRERQPQVPQIACFDTAFHRSHPQIADLYALPWEYYESGVRRYGFHGLSYEYIALTLPKIAPEIAAGRVIVAHLGSGASLCALDAGKSVDSTMGFSPLDGVPMGTRPGTLDPGVLLHLTNQLGLTGVELEKLLYKESGLLGLSGISNDMRILLESRESRAQLAVDYFVHYTVKQIGALAAVLGGVDGIVFTAGIGEHSPLIRARILRACAWLGVSIDAAANERGGPCISSTDSNVSVWVIPTNEELMIARHTLALMIDQKGEAIE